jgi:hypothetical protein
MCHDSRELLEIFSRTADYYIPPSLKDLLIYGIFEKIGDGVQHLEVGLLEMMGLERSTCNKGNIILFRIWRPDAQRQ